jgi:hypothetical protein
MRSDRRVEQDAPLAQRKTAIGQKLPLMMLTPMERTMPIPRALGAGQIADDGDHTSAASMAIVA